MQGAIAEDEGGLALSALTPALGNRSRRGSSSSAAVPDAALPPPSLESCIHAVVSRREREKILRTIYWSDQ